MQLKAARQLKEITEQLAKAKKARESGRSDRDLKALELKLVECQSVVDEVGDPPLKFLKAAERVKLVPPTTHRLGQGGIPGLKAAFVSVLPLLHFFCKDSFLSSHIGLFGIPLRCELHCKDRSNGVCFAKVRCYLFRKLLRKLQYAKVCASQKRS